MKNGKEKFGLWKYYSLPFKIKILICQEIVKILQQDPICRADHSSTKQSVALVKSSRVLENVLYVAYVSQVKPRNHDIRKIHCYSCKELRHMANQYKGRFSNYCKKMGNNLWMLEASPKSEQPYLSCCDWCLTLCHFF